MVGSVFKSIEGNELDATYINSLFSLYTFCISENNSLDSNGVPLLEGVLNFLPKTYSVPTPIGNSPYISTLYSPTILFTKAVNSTTLDPLFNIST